MSSKPYTLYVGSEQKDFEGDITISWALDRMDNISATLRDPYDIQKFQRIQIQRDDSEIFDGRIETPSLEWGDKAILPVNGYDWTVILKHIPTASQSIVDTATATALASILSETSDVSISTSGTFEYITELRDWNTWIEMVMDIDVFSNVTVELDLATEEIVDDVAGVGTYTMSTWGLKTSFFYDGTTQRVYIFARDSGNNIYYFHSPDGDTWTAVDSTVNSTSDSYTVAWYNSKVYLFVYDGANTDFYRGTITDATGAITFALIAGNIFAGTVYYGPVWDDQGDIWVLRSGTAYESTDDGANWNSRFTVGATSLWAISPVGSDGDMYAVELDAPNTDLELWTWDRSAGTYTFTEKITDVSAVSTLDLATTPDYKMYIYWLNVNSTYIASNITGQWETGTVYSSGVGWTGSIGTDGYNAYIIESGAFGQRVYKYYSATLQQSDTFTYWTTSSDINVCAGGLKDGRVGIFFCGIDFDSDVCVQIYNTRGIRLVSGASTGYIQTEAINASGGMTNWGILTTSAIDIGYGQYISADVLDAGDDSEIVTDQGVPFDLEIAGVPSTTTSIKLVIYIEDPGVNTFTFELSEKTDSVSLDTDYEDAYTAVKKLADLAGAEFYVTYDGTDWTLYFVKTRGTDRSSYIILKTAKTNDEPNTTPNIKILNKVIDASNYANCIIFIGGLDSNGDRIVESVRDNATVSSDGFEYWVTVRDGDVVNASMARQRAYVELLKRNTVSIRMSVDFIDKNLSNLINIGDTITVIAEWESDPDLKISGSHRIVELTRSYGMGEHVSAIFTNQLKYAQYWRYMKKTDDVARWATL